MKSKIKHKIENSHYYKFGGIAPEGFVMIPKQTLDRLKDFYFWKEWVINDRILHDQSIEDTKDF